jgi:hypothetical protein
MVLTHKENDRKQTDIKNPIMGTRGNKKEDTKKDGWIK